MASRQMGGREADPSAVQGVAVPEAQHLPNSPHHRNFPSTELVPGKPFRGVMTFRFSTDKI